MYQRPLYGGYGIPPDYGALLRHPHGVVIVDDMDSVDVPALGRALGTHPLFPEGASIIFIQVLDQKSIKARLWQYGEGEKKVAPVAVCVEGVASMMLLGIFCTMYMCLWVVIPFA